MTTDLAIEPPAGFPAPGDVTVHRRLLDAIVDGSAPAPPYVHRLALPRPTGWSPGQASCRMAIPPEVTWRAEVVFGGYAGCLVDMMAGLATTSVLPDRASFLTAGFAVDFLAPLGPDETVVTAAVRELSESKAVVEVVVTQGGTARCRALVTQIIQVGQGKRT